MCGRYTSTSPIDILAEAFAVEEVRTEPLPDRWNVAPSQLVYAVATRRPRPTDESPGGPPVRQLGAFKWGLVPSWAKDPSVGNRMINARAEGIDTRPAFRKALARRRCIIPADAFYEWQVRREGAKPTKLPYAIRRRDGAPLALAGLWEFWRDGDDGDPLRTCTIITTRANEGLSPIHDRMPVVLAPGDWDRWLDPAEENPEAVKGLLVPAPTGDFEWHPVGTRVNNVANEGADLLDPLPDPPNPA